MQIQSVSSAQPQFTGLKINLYGKLPKNLNETEFRNIKNMQLINQELDRMGYDVELSGHLYHYGNSKYDSISACIKKKSDSMPIKVLKDRLAVVSSSDERVVHFPVEDGSEHYSIMYDSVADAEVNAWEYNFGHQILSKAKAAFDVAKDMVKHNLV